ncbi:hypothetical protein CL616_03190 [archaeon]|nr:hypothetical protein [archaeon]
MIPQIIFIILCIIGIIDSSYLIKKRLKKQPLTCPLNDDCNIVTNSKWSKSFGINNDILGLLFYCFLVIALFINLTLVLLLTLIGALFSIYLLYIQKFKIKQFCFYCLISTMITFLLFITALFL